MHQPTSHTKRKCTALRRDGHPCRNWATRASYDGPALCHMHSSPEVHDSSDMPNRPMDGQLPIRAELGPVMGPSDPFTDVLQSTYDHDFNHQEITALQLATDLDPLEGEVRLVRVALLRLFSDFGQEHGQTGPALEGRAASLFRGAEMVARLLRHRQALQEDGDELHEAIGQALDDIGEELGLAL